MFLDMIECPNEMLVFRVSVSQQQQLRITITLPVDTSSASEWCNMELYEFQCHFNYRNLICSFAGRRIDVMFYKTFNLFTVFGELLITFNPLSLISGL